MTRVLDVAVHRHMSSTRRLCLCGAAVVALVLGMPLSSVAQFNPDKFIAPTEADGPGALYNLGATIYFSVQNGKFEETRNIISEALATKKRLTDGQWVVARLFDGYAEWLSTEKQWDEQLSMLQKWQAVDPKGPELALVEARYWLSYAWYARGGGFAGTVPERAWALMRERAAKARAVLDESKPYASGNPVWYSLMIAIANLESRPRTELVAIFNEGVDKEPLFEASYVALANAMVPKWGGQLADYHVFVKASVARTKADEGDTMYARLYWVLAGSEANRPFKELGIRWPDMKAGFDDLMTRHPDSQWNLQNYARFACLADDGKTFNSLKTRFDRRKLASMPNIWRGAYTLDYCTEIFSQRI
jgi:hypothetical protein